MKMTGKLVTGKLWILPAVSLGLAGCTGGTGFDFDFRGNQFDTSNAAMTATQDRPEPDARGVISYPTYQVAVARDGDTVQTIADRLGLSATELAQYNGLSRTQALRQGEVLALPNRVAGADEISSQPLEAEDGTDITALAETAIDQAEQVPNTAITPPKAQTAKDPIRHRVERGETAYTVARLYNVSVRSLADWNGLNAQFAIREGQMLTIPVPNQDPPKRPEPQKPATPVVSTPGSGSATPTPPSATKPLPAPSAPAMAPTQTAPKPVATPTGGQLAYPVKGSIIREYVKGKTEGIDLSAPAGTSVVAAEKGTVAAITADADQVPIMVIKHANNLLTVYANIGNIQVKKGDTVNRGATIGYIRQGNPAYLHFEVRQGFESVDPMDYLK